MLFRPRHRMNLDQHVAIDILLIFFSLASMEG